MDQVAVTVERMARFSGATATTMMVEAVKEVAAWSRARRWRRRRSGMVMTMKAEEERDGSVPRHGGEGQADGGDGMDLAAAVTS
jgi:hypothetical protein